MNTNLSFHLKIIVLSVEGSCSSEINVQNEILVNDTTFGSIYSIFCSIMGENIIFCYKCCFLMENYTAYA